MHTITILFVSIMIWNLLYKLYILYLKYLKEYKKIRIFSFSFNTILIRFTRKYYKIPQYHLLSRIICGFVVGNEKLYCTFFFRYVQANISCLRKFRFASQSLSLSFSLLLLISPLFHSFFQFSFFLLTSLSISVSAFCCLSLLLLLYLSHLSTLNSISRTLPSFLYRTSF